MVRIPDISPVDGEKSLVGRICGTGKFIAWSRTPKEGKQMRLVTIKRKNCHLRKEVKVRETESQEEVQEVDTRLQRKDDTYRKERKCDFQREAGWCTLGSNKISFALRTTDS